MFNAVGAHIYAGGFTCGVRGKFNVLCHLEHSGYGAPVVNLNWPDLPIHAGGPASWPAVWPKGAGRVRFMYANPPCAIWSTASHGRESGWADDPRLGMHKDIFHYAMDVVQPDVLVIESVPPSFVKGREYINWLMSQAGEKGYSTTVAMHNAKWLGVPQQRSRIFYVFHKVDIAWEHPEFTTPKTVRQALRGIRPSKKNGYDTTMPEKYAYWAAKCGPGEGLQKAFDRENPNPKRGERGQVIGRPAFLDHRSPWDEPAGVVIGGKPIHPAENRWMAQEEVAAICGFPKDFKWPRGSFNDITGYMSRGVMPPVAEWLAENIARALERNKRLNSTDAQVLDVRNAPGRLYGL